MSSRCGCSPWYSASVATKRLGLLGERLPRVVAEHVGEAPAAEAEAVFAAGLVEETVGAQVEGPARRQRYLDVAVVATALVADRPARAL